MTDFEKRIGYEFKDSALLTCALTHSSYANEHKRSIPCNERLEFLGDSVLGIVTAEYLFKHYADAEGELTRLRAALVCESSLAKFAKQINLGDEIFLGKGERQTGGNERPSILSDAFEAVIAAIYIDGGKAEAEKFILSFIVDALSHEETQIRDYKTLLQEFIQQNPGEHIEYILVGESGPDHAKSFEVEVHLNSNVIGRGKGKSKKQAEQAAAKEALELMGL